MVEWSIGFSVKLKRRREPPMTGRVFYKDGGHIIEIHDVRQASEFIRGLLPAYPGEEMTKTEPKPKEHQSYHG